MNTLSFVSKHLSIPPVKWRYSAYTALYNAALTNDEALEQLKVNINSDNLDIVEYSLKVILSLSQIVPKKILSIKTDIIRNAVRCEHFKISYYAKRILTVIGSSSLEDKHIDDLITPKSFISDRRQEDYYFSYSCEHGIEYVLGTEKYKFILSDICNAFEYDCKKAMKKVLQIRKQMGHKKSVQYWKGIPSRWSRSFRDETSYQTKLQYFSYHSIQKFFIWCVNNVPITRRSWDKLLREQDSFDPDFITQKISDRPNYIKLPNPNLNVNLWFKQKLKRMDAFQLVNLDNTWITLFENTYIRYEDKVFDKKVATCFANASLSEVKNKQDVFSPHYDCRNVEINDLQVVMDQSDRISIFGNNSREIEGKLLPSYGTISETEFETTFNAIFPAPELVKFLKLKQRKGALDYYRGRELVVQCINWQSGYTATSHTEEDKFQIADYGSILLIKSKHLKAFLKANKLRLLSTAELTKRKIDKYGTGWDYKPEDARRKRFNFELSKAL